MRQFNGTIEGVTPFLFNRYVDPAETLTKIGAMPRDPTKIDAWRKQEGALRVYENGHGLFLPGRNIRSAMVEGAKALGIRHVMNGRKVALWPFLRRGLSVEPLELLFGEADATLHQDMVRVPPRTGALVLKYWPKLDQWNLDFTLTVYDDSIQSEAELQESLHAAGLYCGLGTGRPDFGKFKLTAFAEAA